MEKEIKKEVKKVLRKKATKPNKKKIGKVIKKFVERDLYATNNNATKLSSMTYRGHAIPTDYRKYNDDDLIKELGLFNKHMKRKYLIGLIHPDIAVREGLSPKLYHDVPIPTAAFGVYGSYTATTNASGNMLISCATPGQPHQSVPMQNITVNNNNSLNGTTTSGFNFFVNVCPVVNISTQRYRLVSSLIKVTYTGPLLNQSGSFISCATYDPLAINYYNSSTQAQILADRFGDFNLMKQGLWNTVIPVISGTHSIECLWVPTDTYSYIFQQQFAYGGTPFASGLPMTPTVDGARLGYMIACQGLPASSPCITIEQWTNYEVIADPTSAPYLNHAVDSIFSRAERDEMSDMFNDSMSGASSFIRAPQENVNMNRSWWDVAKSLGTTALPILKDLALSFI